MEQVIAKRKPGRKGGSVKILAGSRSSGLNLNQSEFVRHYTDQSNNESFANGTIAYCKAYNFDIKDSAEKKTAAAEASRLLSNGNIIQAISKELENLTLNDSVVDNKLAFIINSFDKRYLLPAIHEYNLMHNRIRGAGNQVNILNVESIETALKDILSPKA